MAKRRTRRAEAHVRLYRHELECAAFRTLTTDARALLIEMRALYDGKNNRFFLSVREMQRRLGVGQRRAQHARDELLERGWIRLLKPGCFRLKAKHASEYALLNEPLEGDGSPTKHYMRWQPPDLSTVAATATDGSRDDCRAQAVHATCDPLGSRDSYRKEPVAACSDSHDNYTDSVTRAGRRVDDALLRAAVLPGVEQRAQFAVCIAYLVLFGDHGLQEAA